MRGRTIVLFAIALLLAGGTALLVRSWLAQRPAAAAKAPAPPPAPQKSILVARAALARGQILKPGDFAWRPWPESAMAGGFVVASGKTKTSFAGWVVREPFAVGEPIVKTKIVAPGERGFLAAVLQPGMRAVSVALNPTSDVSGFIFPGDRVDLLIDLSVPAEATGGGFRHQAAETVLRDIRVIAIDQRLDSKDGQAVVARTATLEVTPKESEIVSLADQMGKVTLSLRSLVATQPPGPAMAALADPPAALAEDAADRGSASAVDGGGAGGDGAAGPGPRPTDGAGEASFTLDSEVSPLLPKPFGGQNQNDGKVTILRGNGNNGTSVSSQPASRGS